MGGNGWKRLAVVGLLGVAGLSTGCGERRQGEVREDARQVGKEVGEAAREARDASREALEGFREGLRDSEPQQGTDVKRDEGR